MANRAGSTPSETNSTSNMADRLMATQKRGATLEETGGNIAKGFMQGGWVGAAIEAIKAGRKAGKNARNNAMNLGKEMMKAGQEQNESMINEADTQLANNQQALNDIVENSSTDGIMTGGASNVNNNPLNEYEEYLRNNGYSEDVVNGVSQGLNSGYPEVAQWQQQYNQGAGKDNPIRIPQTTEEIELARQGQFNVPVQQAEIKTTQQPVEQQVNDNQAVKDSLLAKFANGMSDFVKGYEENRNNGLKSENLLSDDKKGKMTRTGEAFGTIARALNRPTVQGLIAGVTTGALSGNPMIGLGNAYKFANKRDMNDMYNQVLAENGIDVNPGTFGNIGKDDFNALYKVKYESDKNDILRDKVINDYDYKNAKLEHDINNDNRNYELNMDKYKLDLLYKKGLLDDKAYNRAMKKIEFDYKKDYDKQKLALEDKKINAYNNRTSSNRKKSEKIKDTPEYKEDLAKVMEAFYNQKKYDFGAIRADFINKYGVDSLKDIAYSYTNADDEDDNNWLKDFLE